LGLVSNSVLFFKEKNKIMKTIRVGLRLCE